MGNEEKGRTRTGMGIQQESTARNSIGLNDTPLVSIIVPIHDIEPHYLDDMMESIRSQEVDGNRVVINTGVTIDRCSSKSGTSDDFITVHVVLIDDHCTDPIHWDG